MRRNDGMANNVPLFEGTTWRSAVIGCSILVAPQLALAQGALDSSFFRGLQWRNVAPSVGGRASAGVGVASDPQTYYMGATGGGVWKTENAGETWRNISDGFFNTGTIGDIAVFQRSPSILYVGTGEPSARSETSTFGDGVYKSTDAGRTWRHVGLTNTKQIARVVIHPTDSNLVYVAGQGDQWGPNEERGIFRTKDGGATWTRVLFVNSTAGASDLVMDPTNPRVLYAAMWDHDRGPGPGMEPHRREGQDNEFFRTTGPGSGIWKSTDGGDTWTRLRNGLPPAMGKVRIGLAASNPNRLYATIEADSGGVFRTDDAGATWRMVNGSRAVTTRAWYYLGTEVDPRNPDVVYVMGVAMLKSTDGGVTFNSIPIGHSDSHTLWINPSNPQNMIGTNDGGAEVTFDGGRTWSPQDNQPTAQFYPMSVDDLFPYNLYAGQQDASSVKISSRPATGRGDGGGGGGGGGGRNFSSVGGGETARLAFDPKNPRIVYATTYWGIIEAYDTQTGLSRMITEWPQEPFGTTPRRHPFNWTAALNYSPTRPGVIYHAGTEVFMTRNGGFRWDAISPKLTRVPGRGTEYSTIFDVVESPHDSLVVWAGTDEGVIQVTRNGGRTWTNVTPPGMPEGQVNAIEVSPHDPGTTYFALWRLRWQDYRPYIYKTTDYGRTWTQIGSGLPGGFPARVVREDPNRRDLLYAGTENGVFVSFDAGKRWQSLQANLPRVPISGMKINQGDLVVGTEGRAFWILDDVSPLQQLSDAASTAALTLYRPRPTPRAISSSERGVGSVLEGVGIWYSLASSPAADDTLKLEIVDSRGTVVRRVVSGSATAGGPGAGAAGGRGAGRGGRGGGGGPADVLTTNRGLNRYVWNFRASPLPGATGPGGAPNAVRGGSAPAGYFLPSGRYTARMTLGATTVSQPLEVLMDPRVSTSIAWEEEHANMARAIIERTADINALIARVRNVKTQARALAERAKVSPNASRDRTIASFLALADSLDEKLLQNRYSTLPGTQDFLMYPPGLITEYSYLLGLVDGSFGPLTQAERERFADLESQWGRMRARAQALFTTEVQRVNAAAASSGVIPGLTAPPPGR